MTRQTTATRAATIRAWLLGNKLSERALADMARRSLWSDEQYSAAFALALRIESIVWDATSRTWSASRSWASHKITVAP